MKRMISLLISFIVISSLYGQNDQKCQMKRLDDIQNAKIAFFTSQINLTPEEATDFWPLYNEYFRKAREAHKQTNKSFRALRNAAETPEIPEREIQSLTRTYLQSRKDASDLELEYLDRFNKILSPGKVAKIYVAEEEFRVRMIHQWRSRTRGEEK